MNTILSKALQMVGSMLNNRPMGNGSVTIGNGNIDWSNPNSSITQHFTVGNALMLHQWNRIATEKDGVTPEVQSNIKALCEKLEQVMQILGCGMNIHCIFRSVEYNQEVLHSLPHDVHSMGEGIDMDCGPHYTIQQVKDKLEPLLNQLQIRMEYGTSSWIHLDIHSVGPSGRYFKT